MKTLSEEEKEIIKLIQSKKITDIYSYVQYYNLGTEIQQFKEDVEQRFNEKFKDKKYKCHIIYACDLNADNIIEQIDEKTVWATPIIDYRGCEGQVIKYSEEMVHGFHIFRPTYICENVEKIFHFISVWQYLVSEGLVIELPKSCEEQDMALFLRKEKIKHNKQPIDEESQLLYSNMEVNASYFMAWKFALDKVNFELCLPYLQKRIHPTLGLDTFISKGFKTKADLNESRNFKIALAGVIVAIITSVASLLISLLDEGYSNELKKINNSLQEIHEALEPPTQETIEETTIPEE